MTIRHARLSDTPVIGQMWAKLVAYHRALDRDLPEALGDGGKRYARRVEERLNDPYTCVLVAEVDEQVVGFVLGMVVNLTPDIFKQERSGFLADIYVEEAYRKHGVGSALVRALEAWFDERGLSYYEWHVAEVNQEARSFWQRLGGRDKMIRMRADLRNNR